MKKQISYDLFEVDERVKARKKKRARKAWLKEHSLAIIGTVLTAAGVVIAGLSCLAQWRSMP